MPFRPFFRSLALPLAAGLLFLGLACKGKKRDANTTGTTSVFLSGKVTFDRVPVVRNAGGVPTGLETNAANFLLNQPAKYVRVVLYQEVTVTENNVTSTFYRVPSNGVVYTLNDGTYAFQVLPGTKYMVEVQSGMTVGSGANFINITADPAGMSSLVPVVNRLRYCIRQDLAGNRPPTAPGVNHVAVSAIQADTTMNVHIGVGDTWFLADTDMNLNYSLPITRVVPTYSPSSPQYAFAGQAESTASGSKVLGILDSIATFGHSEGLATNSFQVLPSGGYLDLNYISGTAAPGGTQIGFNRNSYPLLPGPSQQSVAYDPEFGVLRYLGTVNGSPDDAWDEGLILTLMARSSIYSQLTALPMYVGTFQNSPALPPLPIGQALPDLHANLALSEGLPELMAALIQKNPYLGLAAKDVRDISALTPAEKTIYSAPFIRAFGWEAALLEQGITSPGTVTDWANLKINNMRPFFVLSAPTLVGDTPNFYLQMNSLAAAGTTAAGLTPSSIFTTSAVQNLLASAPLSVPAGNIPWPRPASGPLVALQPEWGPNPSGVQPDLSLTMSSAVQVNGAYPNLSHGELSLAHFTQTGVKQFAVDIALLNGTSPATLTGGQVEVTFISPNTPSGTLMKSFKLSTSTPTPLDLLLEGRSGVAGEHYVRIRMLSPNTVQPDTTVRITLTPQN